jgi:hypothetical protein
MKFALLNRHYFNFCSALSFSVSKMSELADFNILPERYCIMVMTEWCLL